MSSRQEDTRASARDALGFRDGQKGTHSARTLMLAEFSALMEHAEPQTSLDDYRRLIVDENVLAKPTSTTRNRTFRIIKPLYGLDPEIPIFRTLAQIWRADTDSQPLLALLIAYARDPLLRLATPEILNLTPGKIADRAAIEAAISERFPDRFSQNTLASMGGNILSTFTQSGHLEGHSYKTRGRAQATALSAAFAFYLAYLEGFRAQRIFSSVWAKLLDAPGDELLTLSQQAGRMGWLNYRESGDVLELRFPEWITSQEEAWTHEQQG